MNTSAAVQLREQLWRREPREYFQNCLKIADKATSVAQQFELNTHQRKIQDAIDGERRKGKPVRILILKPRQTGISTVSSANIFHGVRFYKGIGMIVSKDMDSSEHIFSMEQRFYHYLPDSEKRSLKTEASNRKELKFSEPHGGRIVVETAGKTGAGHSFTIRHLLLSEVPRWPENTDDTFIGLLNAVPYEPNTTIIVEGVANGMSGWFYREWMNPESDYVKVFLPFKEHDEYTRELPLPEPKYRAQLTHEEKQLIAQHDLTLGQIEFRRWAIRNNCKGNPETFKEQYPLTARDAFITSGRTFFDQKTLEGIESSPGTQGDLQVFSSLSGERDVRFVPNERGLLTLWRKPQRSSEYVIGADPAEGVEIEGAPQNDKHDYSSADVLDRETGEQACHLHGRITPDEFGRQLALLGEWYRHAFVGIETNAGYGNHAIETMKNDCEWPDHLLYKQTVMDETIRRPTKKVGWKTTRANRKTLLSNLDTAVRGGEVLINSEHTVQEMRTFVNKPDGRIEHDDGEKDDRVFSLAIATEMLEAAPPRTTRSETTPAGALTVMKYKPSRVLMPARSA